MIPPISVKKLTKKFGSKPVLRSIDLEVPSGTVLGLLGQNGSGKSTLIKCMLGLLKLNRGQATIFGDKAWHLSTESKARLGYVPQEVVTYPWMRVRQVIAYTASFYPTWNQEFADRLCQQWHLPLEDRTGTLSAGQMQALGIVLALGHEPELLILDEPVASLDPSARRQFLQTLVGIIDHPGRTVLFSTHITSDLERIANRIVILREGQVAFHGELDELKNHVKRLRISSRWGFPDDFNVPGALHLEKHGNSATVCVTNFEDSIPRDLNDKWNVDVTVHDLNLEEIFVELHNH